MSGFKLNEHYFDKIDTEEKAYWLGFIWADGTINYRVRDNGQEEYALKIDLKDTDYKHLKKFIECIDGKMNVKYYGYNKSFRNGVTNIARVRTSNKHFVKTLYYKCGIIPNRTDCSLCWNNIEDKYKIDFIRGIIDGDGSFLYTKYKKLTVNIGSTESTLLYIKDFLLKQNLITNKITHFYKRHKEVDRDGDWRTLRVCGKSQGLKLLDVLYGKSTIYLDRKYNKYLEIKNQLLKEESEKR